MLRAGSLLALLIAFGCAGRATSTNEAGGANAMAGSSATGASAGSGGASGGASDAGAGVSGQGCPFSCPAPFFGLQLLVTTSGGHPVPDVQATLSGPATIKMSCSAEADGSVCSPQQGGPEGSYSLEVLAPQFQTVTVDATVSYASTPGCGCRGATIEPSTVILYPMRL
jgi:hypothetical protein